MSESFRISVIIPVYRAGEFIERAVTRILEQPEVAEVVLMEDGSPDDSLAKCRMLAERHSCVKVYQHPNGENRGCGETRNAGIQYTTCEFVAFADADNLYLPERFKRDREIFESDPSIDGVYNAQGIHYESDAAREKFAQGGLAFAELLSVSAPVPPEELLSVMLGIHPTAKMIAGLGIDAITLRRRCFEKAGYFEKELRLQQDVHFFFKLAAACRMAPSNIETPVALRGVHESMRSTDPAQQDKYRRLRWQLLEKWARTTLTDRHRRQQFIKAHADFRMRDAEGWRSKLRFVSDAIKWPAEIFQIYGRFDTNYLEVFRNRRLPVKLLSVKNRILRTFSRTRQP